jgi:mono/diheme cytochrome c family protein
MITKRQLARTLLVSIPAVALLIQLVPYGRSHENPPVVSDAPWNTPRTKTLFLKACGDCHSNQTAWPWYSAVAPLSWILQRDVREGREHLNVSAYGPDKYRGDRAADRVRDGEMPPAIYRWVNPAARLTTGETEELLGGLEATFGPRQ